MVIRFALSLIITLCAISSSFANLISQVRPAAIDAVEIDKRASQLMHQLEMVGMSVALV